LISSFHEAYGEINVGTTQQGMFFPTGFIEFQTKDCPPGFKAIGAGWQSLNPDFTRIIDSEPFDETSWKLKFFTGEPGGDGPSVFTICASDVFVQNLSKEVTLSTFGLLEENPPQCPSEFKVVGAGWAGLDKDKTQLHETKPVDQTTWSLGFVHNGNGDTITIYSVCVKSIDVKIILENFNIDSVNDNIGIETPPCPSGFQIVGPAWEGGDPVQTRVHEIGPTPTGWNVQYRFTNPGGDSFTVYSICIDEPMPIDTEIVFKENFDGILTGWSESLCNTNDPSQVCSIGQVTRLPQPPNESPNSLPNWGFVQIAATGAGSSEIPVEVRYQKSFNVAQEADYEISAVLGVNDCSSCVQSAQLFIDGILIFEESGVDLTIEPSGINKFFDQGTIHLTAGPHNIEIAMHSTGALGGNFRASFDDIIIRQIPADLHENILTEVQNIEEKLDGDRPSLITQIVDTLASIATDIGTVLGILQDENSGLEAIKSDTEMIKDQVTRLEEKIDSLLASENDDPATPSTVSIDDVSITEGNAGLTAFTFTVTRSDNTDAISVDLVAADGTATTADNDYQAAGGTLTFNAGGLLSKTVKAQVNGDTKVELDETFFVNLSNCVGCVILDNQGQGIIQNDDADPITVSTAKQKFEPGETILFSITATPNEQLTILIEDPSGNEVLWTTIDIPSSGSTNLEFLTNFLSPQGTYTLFAMQDGEFEIFRVGLGELPQVQLIVKMDKLNYATGEIAKVEIQGPTSSTVTLLVIDPSDKPKFSEAVILGPEGQKTFDLDLTGYASGVYTIVVTRGNAQADDVFSVGLQIGSGPIKVLTTKETYQPGEMILILGNTSPNVLLTLELIDPNGEIVKTKETFTNKDGLFSENIRIPVDAQEGVWTVKAKSGANFATVEITVGGSAEGLIVFVEDIVQTPSGTQVNIKGSGAAVNQNVVLLITSSDGTEIVELTTHATGTGNFETLWIVPSDLPLGTYTITARDAFDEAQTSFVLE